MAARLNIESQLYKIPIFSYADKERKIVDLSFIRYSVEGHVGQVQEEYK